MEFLNIEIDAKKYIKILLFFIVLVIIYFALTMSSFLIFKSYTLGPNTSVNDQDINTHIDVLEHNGKKIEIAGWAYKEDEPITTVKANYVLKNEETDKMYLMRTQMEENININEEDHKLAGIHAQCLLFGIPKGRYDIYVLYQNGDEDILANTLIYVDL
jgi:hypothetical protein